ncbi:hypothetical protein SteCoe_14962 [Stentor coeruleus]|uniref:Uncharacterized protein n=1 Tax=Stentor coeruleus TaxID=5963 RepID=A0A1R2C4M6_9CILI|nr:hypothetical protein SteCoe_14962 [Stentor coeruleus]
MRIKVSINSKTYEINCGTGIQDLAWLAMTAAYLYGKENYPRGFHQPTLLSTVNGRVTHPRKRINAALKDGDEVIVTLKDPSQPQPKQHAKWYRKAYGDLRNIMKLVLQYSPRVDFSSNNRNKASVIVKFIYTMYKELKNEFDEEKFPQNQTIELKQRDETRKEFIAKIILPFGEIKQIKLYEIYPSQKESSEIPEPRELPPDEKNNLTCLPIPEPWSKNMQKQAMILEEQEHKRREEEAVKKAQEQLQRVEANPTAPVRTLYDVWPDAPSALAPHFPLLYDVFSIYANYHLPEEDMLSAHDFFHFLRAFDLVSDYDDMIQLILELGDDIEAARNEVLKAKINLNHFLNLLVKFSEIRNPQDTAYHNLIDTMSKSKAIWLQDFVKSEIIKPEISELFMENYDDLTTKYFSRASKVEGVIIDIKVNDFIAMVMECEQLADVVTSEKVKQICEDTLFFSSFKDSQILYPDFLENLVRLAQVVPFNEEEIMQAFSNQPETMILAEKLHSIIRILCGSKAPQSAGSRGISRGK